MTMLTEMELTGLDPIIDARKMTSDVSDKYEQIVIPIGNAGEIKPAITRVWWVARDCRRMRS